jgi:hypothetical protein
MKACRFLAKMVAVAKALFWQSHHNGKIASPKTGTDHFIIFTI